MLPNIDLINLLIDHIFTYVKIELASLFGSLRMTWSAVPCAVSYLRSGLLKL